MEDRHTSQNPQKKPAPGSKDPTRDEGSKPPETPFDETNAEGDSHELVMPEQKPAATEKRTED